MYGIQFEHQRGPERSNLALVGCAVHSLIPIVDSDLKVTRICPQSNRNNFIGAGGK
jgi:hypothetical protein